MNEGDLQREFGADWEISLFPAGLEVCQAVHRQDSSISVVTKRTPGELLETLRKMRDRDYGNGLPIDEEA